jgi:hypothetical protein
MGAAKLSNRGLQAGADGEEAAGGGKCDGGAVGVRVRSGTPYRARCGGVPTSGGGWESVHGTTEMRWRPNERRRWEIGTGTTLATLDEQSRCQVGPTILPDRPRPGLPFNRFLLSNPGKTSPVVEFRDLPNRWQQLRFPNLRPCFPPRMAHRSFAGRSSSSKSTSASSISHHTTRTRSRGQSRR